MPAPQLAAVIEEVATAVIAAVFEARQRADRVIAQQLRPRRGLALADQRLISQAVFGWFRWRGWLEGMLGREPLATQLLAATLLEASEVPQVCRHWARAGGIDPSALVGLGDAPGWPERVRSLKRMFPGRSLAGDPWRLVPPWVRPLVPEPPGEEPPKHKYAAFLNTLQTRSPLWLRAQGPQGPAVWNELRSQGVKPWVHRRMDRSARVEADVDVYHLDAFKFGRIEIQDLASQAVALACDPEPGERWWDACCGGGGKALQLADLMNGKGVVVASDRQEWRLKEAVRRVRKSPFRNVTTRLWDGKRPAGKAGSFDGVLVDAPCSALGSWRRNPDARWTLEPEAIERLAAQQASILAAASAGVRPGGVLVYAVCTITPAETTRQVESFLAAHPQFQLDPFAHPFDGTATSGKLLIWPGDGDCDAMFMARMIRARRSAVLTSENPPQAS